MNGRTITFLATILSSTIGMILFVILIAVAAIKGWGQFSKDEWINTRLDNRIAYQEAEDEKEKFPELYEGE